LIAGFLTVIVGGLGAQSGRLRDLDPPESDWRKLWFAASIARLNSSKLGSFRKVDGSIPHAGPPLRGNPQPSDACPR
jgi:hypothetical protein